MEFKRFKIVTICLMIKIKFLARKFFVLFQSAQHFYGKSKVIVTNDPDADPGGPKTCGSGTLPKTELTSKVCFKKKSLEFVRPVNPNLA
jgi:hypothetical protein